MEQARFWMLASSKSSSSESNFVLPVSSWEEEAFKEDAAGPFGAFIWPPRSYRCSFCGREFRSAQALGGHMNVHRRDRARASLKQSSPPPERNILHNKKYDIQKHSESTIFQYPNHTSTMDNNTNNVDTNSGETLASLSPITASKMPFYSSHSSSSDPAAVRSPSVVDSNIEEEFYTKKQNSRPHEGDTVEHDFSVSLNLNLAVASGNNKMASCKRRRTDGISLPFFLNATTEELDLELRLGGQPKVK